MSSKRRVVVTGLGIVSPLGNDLETTWKNILNGESGAARITKFDASDFSTTFAAELKGYDPSYRVNYFENIILRSFFKSNASNFQFRIPGTSYLKSPLLTAHPPIGNSAELLPK